MKQKVGEMIMVGLKREELTYEEKQLLRDYPFGGFTLFSHNSKEPKQILSLCRSLWEIRKDTPPFIAIDQEGGRVHRLPPPFTHFPAATALGRTGSSELAYNVGHATARELAAVGINLNFAPVLDVHSNPDNPVIGDRALSSDSTVVARLGWAIIEGLRAGGVIPCGKHFPGHGDTAKDSHLELPVVKKDAASLRSLELVPFVRACRKRIESLMTAHVLYPSLDPDHPATLSRLIVTNLLRQELTYKGVVFGDDLEMKAISENYSLQDAVLLSIEAGVDALLFPHDPEKAVRAYEFLYRQAENNKEVRANVEESDRRIRRIKRRYLKSFSGVREDELERFIGPPAHRKLVDEIQGSL